MTDENGNNELPAEFLIHGEDAPTLLEDRMNASYVLVISVPYEYEKEPPTQEQIGFALREGMQSAGIWDKEMMILVGETTPGSDNVTEE